jgi:hypothetical protein
MVVAVFATVRIMVPSISNGQSQSSSQNLQCASGGSTSASCNNISIQNQQNSENNALAQDGNGKVVTKPVKELVNHNPLAKTAKLFREEIQSLLGTTLTSKT